MQVLKALSLAVFSVALGGCLALQENDTVTRFEPPEGAKRLLSPAPHNFQRGRRAIGDPVRRGDYSERFELRDGDCDGANCGVPRARAEIQLDAEAHPVKFGEDVWYGYSFLNATVPSFERENSLRLVFGQWTMGGTNKPIIRFIQLGRGESAFTECDPRICNTRDRSNGDLVVQLEDIAKAQNWGDRQNDGYVCRLFDLEKSRGQWMDIMMNTNFSAGQDGYLRIWVNQKLVCNYTGPLVSPASLAAGEGPRHRRGVYSSWTKRWQKTQGARTKPRMIVYYDEFRIGKQMSEVDVRQLDAANVRPVN